MQGYLFQGQKEKIQAKRMRLNIAVEITEEVDYAGTITLPIGQSGYAGELHMRPGEGDADDGHGKNDRCDDVCEREPPARQQQPNQVADQAQRSERRIAGCGRLRVPYGKGHAR
jgi:hypothetical protein